MPKIIVNNKEVEFEEGMTVLQACELAGAEIPRFCYHEKLSIAGNCRMCLVEMEKSPKPIASCAMPAAEGMVIKTNTEKVEKSKIRLEGVFLIPSGNAFQRTNICSGPGTKSAKGLTWLQFRKNHHFPYCFLTVSCKGILVS